MQATQRRMIVIAVVICGFATGMAGLLNYFKYRSTANHIVTERLVVTGRAIETVVHVALDLGLQFSEIATLPATLERERSTDNLIQGIDVFDDKGTLLYSTDRQRIAASVPPTWLAAVNTARGSDWMVEDAAASAVGLALKNSFGVTMAHLALRFSRSGLDDENAAVARQLALNTLIVFVLSAALAAAALMAVLRRLAHHLAEAEAALGAAGLGTAALAAPDAEAAAHALRGPFGAKLQQFNQTVREAGREIAELEGRLQRGGAP